MNSRPHPIHPPPTGAGDGAPLKTLLYRIASALATHDVVRPPLRFDATHCSSADQDLLNQVMGEGEVSIVVNDDTRIQESVLAGLWRVVRTRPDGGVRDWIEVGAVPSLVLDQTFADAVARIDDAAPPPDGEIMNAPPLLAEINGRLAREQAGDVPHAINLTLLPMTAGDLAFLEQRLGPGRTTILSRGYGNCRMTSTHTRHVWWVQYFNSQDERILNQIEISPIPRGACAAEEDLRDSGRRLHEMLETLP